MRDRAIVRIFDPERDLDAAYRAFFSAFHHDHWPFLDEADPDFARDVVMLCSKFATHPLVVEVDGRVGGILFGLCAGESLMPIPRGLAYSIGHLLPRIMIGRYEMSSLAVRHLLRYASDWGPYVTCHPQNQRHSEAILFCAHRDFQGKGLGRLLMDRLFEEARASGAPSVTLCTDTTMSWTFYESYGFLRAHTFPMRRAYKIAMPGETVDGIIYEKKV